VAGGRSSAMSTTGRVTSIPPVRIVGVARILGGDGYGHSLDRCPPCGQHIQDARCGLPVLCVVRSCTVSFPAFPRPWCHAHRLVRGHDEGARACRRPPAVHAQQPRRSARTSYCGARPVLQTTVARRPSPGDPSMPVPSRDSLRDDLRRLIASRTGPLVVAHRGTPLGSFPDNTVRAAIGALRSGADVIETDVVRSADGEYFLFHTGYERKLLDADVDVRAMSAR